jgi:hypothetical protein
VAPIANGTVYRVEITGEGFAAALWD